MAENSEDKKYPLHKCVFQGDVKTLSSMIRMYDIAEKDKQGHHLIDFLSLVRVNFNNTCDSVI